MALSPGFLSHLPTWRHRLAFRIGVWQTAVAGALILAALWLIIDGQKQERDELASERNLAQGQRVLAKLEYLVTELNTLALAIASVATSQHQDPEAIQRALPGLLSLPHDQKLIISGGIWPEPDDGTAASTPRPQSLFWVRDTEGELNINNGYNQGQHYLEQDWYKPIRQFPAGRVYWSPVYTDPVTRVTMVSAAVPLWRDHQFQGAITLDVSIAALSAFLNNKAQEQDAYVILLDRFNHLIAAPPLPGNITTPAGELIPPQLNLTGLNFTEMVKHYPQFKGLLALITGADKALIETAALHPAISRAQLGALSNPLFQQQGELYWAILNHAIKGTPEQAQLIGTIQMNHDPVFDGNVLMSVYQMPGTFWKLVTVTPMTSLQQQVLQLAGRTGIYLLLIQLITLVFLFLIQDRMVFRPLSGIVRALKSNNDATLELTATGRQDEIASLAKVFMARTRQLEVAKASLDAANLALEQQLAVQQEAKEILLSHHAHLNALLKYAPTLIYLKDCDGNYVLVNDKFCETLGLEPGRMLGKTDRQLFSPAHASLYTQHDSRVMGQDRQLLVEETLPTRIGEQRFQIAKFAIQDDEGAPTGIGAIGFPIKSQDSHHHLQAQLEALKARLMEAQQQNLALENKLQQLNITASSPAPRLSPTEDPFWRSERRLIREWERYWLGSQIRSQEQLLAVSWHTGDAGTDEFKDLLLSQRDRLLQLEKLSARRRFGKDTNPRLLLETLIALAARDNFGQDIIAPKPVPHAWGTNPRASVQTTAPKSAEATPVNFKSADTKVAEPLMVKLEGTCANVALDSWLLSLLLFVLLKRLAGLERTDKSAPLIEISLLQSGNCCELKFSRRGVLSGQLDEELTQLSAWLESQGGGSLSLLPTQLPEITLFCRLPLAG